MINKKPQPLLLMAHLFLLLLVTTTSFMRVFPKYDRHLLKNPEMKMSAVISLCM